MVSPAALPQTSAEVIALIDHAILQPTVTLQDIDAELDRLDGVEIASLCIKPYAVERAVKRLPKTAVGTVIGFPHGSPTTATKVYETKEALDAGAVDIDMVVNIGWVKGRAWAEVGNEIEQLSKVTHGQSGVLKVIFENDLLVDDALKIELCHLCSQLEVDFVKTSTGFGFAKQPEGHFAAIGATEHDVELMRRETKSEIGVKASGGIRSLDDLLKMVAAGANRIGSAATFNIQEEAIARFGR